MLVLTISVLAYYAQKTNQKMISPMLEKMLNLNAKCFLENDVELIPELWQNVVAAQAGIPAFTPAGYGTEVAEGKEVREFNGKMHVMELAFKADFAIVKAERRYCRKSNF
jgi:acyl CoA:acetate/3-ketoacid CoA transferase alpha subunit